MRVSAPFLTRTGRVRIGWRLAGFFGVTLLVGAVAGTVAPAGVVGGAGALLVGALCAGWLMLALDGRRPRALGFHLSTWSAVESAWGTACGVLIGMIVIAGMALAGGVTWVQAPGTMFTWVSAAMGSLLWFALPAAAEEAVLRGYPLQALTESYGPAVAIGSTSVAFGALHGSNPGIGVLEMLNIMVAGVLLGVLYVRTLSLWWVTGAHVGWNWAHGFLADVTVSGLDVVDAPLYEGITTGPAWVGGGAFGPEGSVVASVVLTAAVVWLWRTDRLAPSAPAAAAGSLAMKNDEPDEEKD